MQFNYTVSELDSTYPQLQLEDELLVSRYEVVSSFDPRSDFVELKLFPLTSNLVLESIPDFKGYRVVSEAVTNRGVSTIEVDPVQDILSLGYDLGDVVVEYGFFSSIFENELYVVNISSNRTEIRADIKGEGIFPFTVLEAKFLAPDFPNIFIQIGEEKYRCVNFKQEDSHILIKLYEPLPVSIAEKTLFSVREQIGDQKRFKVETTVVSEPTVYPSLKGPNFTLEVPGEKVNSTEYLSYDQLLGSTITSSTFEVYSKILQQGIELGVDYSSFENFIHFSSAKERLQNFRYKLNTIVSYQTQLEAAPSGSTLLRAKLEGLIEGMVSNFDHYERFLYYGKGPTYVSGSGYVEGISSWPKESLSKPYTPVNLGSSLYVDAWYESQLELAEEYDNQNPDRLVFAVPEYVRDDSNSEPYLLFVDMVGHHFDNLWIYTKAVSNRYSGDNRLNQGIPKGLVRYAIEGLGIQIKDSPKDLENLFSTFVGEETDSEEISTFHRITSGSVGFEGEQPTAQEIYQQEIYKRVYHNIPILLKSKGTERGLRTLINCFGIPESILKIRTLGGIPRSGSIFSPSQEVEGQENKIFVVEQEVEGTTLSNNTSIVKTVNTITDNLHIVEVGFDLSGISNENIKLELGSSFKIDDYIGDPREVYQAEYDSLLKLEQTELEGQDLTYTPITPYAFIRLLKFYDTTLFRMLGDFIPARANLSTGIIVKSHYLHRSKAKQVKVSTQDETLAADGNSLEGEINIGAISAGEGGIFPTMEPIEEYSGSMFVGYKAPYTTDYNYFERTPEGPVERRKTGEEVRYTGELQGAYIKVLTGELTANNPFHNPGPAANFTLNGFTGSIPLDNIEFSVENLGSYYEFSSLPSNQGYVTVSSSLGLTSGTGFSYTYKYPVGVTTISATATPSSTLYEFVSWSLGGTPSTDNPTIISSSSDIQSYVANFRLIPSLQEETISFEYRVVNDDILVSTVNPTPADVTVRVRLGVVRALEEGGTVLDRYVDLDAIITTGNTSATIPNPVGERLWSYQILRVNNYTTPPVQVGNKLYDWSLDPILLIE